MRASPRHMHLDNSLCVPGILGSGMEAIHLACLQRSGDTSSYLLSCVMADLPPLGSGLHEGENWAQGAGTGNSEGALSRGLGQRSVSLTLNPTTGSFCAD